MEYWLKEDYYNPIQYENIDMEKASMYSQKAAAILEQLLPDILFFQYEELIQNLVILEQSEILRALKKLIPSTDLKKFKLKIIEGKISTLTIEELKKRNSCWHPSMVEKLIARLLDENEIKYSLQLLSEKKIKLENFVTILCNSKIGCSEIADILKTLRFSEEFSIRHFCFRIGRDILNNKIELAEGMYLFNLFDPLSDLDKRVMSYWLSVSKNYNEVRSIYNTIDSKEEFQEGAISLAKHAICTGDQEFRNLCSELLNSSKMNKEVKLYSILNKVCTPDLKLNQDLLDILNSNKRFQPDDEIFYYLVQQNRLEDAKLFVDVAQGVNKIHHYSALVKFYMDEPKKLESLFEEKRYSRIAEAAVKHYSEMGKIEDAMYWLIEKINDSRMQHVLWRHIMKALILENDFEAVDIILSKEKNQLYKFSLNLFVSSFLVGKSQL